MEARRCVDRRTRKRVWTPINEILDRSAALSYYFIFALFPTLLFLTALLGAPPHSHLLDRLMAYVRAFFPGTRGAGPDDTGPALQGAHAGLLSVGAVTALWQPRVA